MLPQILEENLDENTTTRRRFFFVQVNDRHDMPADGVSAEHMTKEPRNVAQTVGFVAMNRVVVFGKRRLKQVTPEPIDLGKPLANQAVKLGVCSLLGAAFDNHGWKLWLQAGRQGNLHQFVATFFEIYTRHDRQVNCSAKIDKISIALILDVHLLRLVFFFVRGLVRFILVLLIIGTFP